MRFALLGFFDLPKAVDGAGALCRAAQSFPERGRCHTLKGVVAMCAQAEKRQAWRRLNLDGNPAAQLDIERIMAPGTTCPI
jgi:hypothetical protein